MVKRTLFVLGILSIAVMVAGTSFAFMGGLGLGRGCGTGGWESVFGGPDMATYVAAPCWPYPVPKTIVRTWEAKISAPVPVAGYGCGPGFGGVGKAGIFGRGWLGNARPFALCDILFGGFDGISGCGDMPGGACAVHYGPLPAALVACPCIQVGQLGTATIFGGLF